MMNREDESIEALARAVVSEARAEAETKVAEAKAKADAILQRAKEQADAERAEILKRASQEAARIRSQTVATTQLKARTLQLESREKLLDNVFKTAQQKLPSIQQWAEYPQIARELLREALVRLGAPAARIQVDDQTRKHLTDQVLTELSKEVNVQLEFGSPLKQGMGVIVETLDRHRQYDNTLEARLNRMQNTLRSRVYHLLMGESL
jgi:V/A-type H+-transporting ATPase subunit E